MIQNICNKVTLLFSLLIIIINANAQWNIVHYDTTCYLFGLYFTDSLTGYTVGSQPDSMNNKSLIKKNNRWWNNMDNLITTCLCK